MTETGTGPWWGCALNYASGESQNLNRFKEEGKPVFSIRAGSACNFQIGLQSGNYAKGNFDGGKLELKNISLHSS